MMAAQAVQFAETIRAMKLAIRRNTNTDQSDSDESIRARTNRGNKLKRQASNVREGRLDNTGGLSYRRSVNHAGYSRFIISKKPKLYDEDGDVIEPLDFPKEGDVGDDEPYGDAVEDDAFGHVRLEHLLRPVTSAAELPSHPSLSIAYTSHALTQMAEEAAKLLRREKASLWKTKRLLERFRGDGGWAAVDIFTSEHDRLLLPGSEEADLDSVSAGPSMLLDENLTAAIEDNTLESRPDDRYSSNNITDAMDGVETHDHVLPEVASGESAPNASAGADEEPTTVNGDATSMESRLGSNNNENNDNLAKLSTIHNDQEGSEPDSASRSGTNAHSHAMTTRARARSPQQLASSPSPSPSDSGSVPAVHPWFLAPREAIPDRDLGLPPKDAEETRKLLLLYVQKQENVVRQLETLYKGLQRTDRLRQEVWTACKAEAHMIPDGKGGVQTEMSDGEDWYDPQDWNLHPSELTKDGKLEKGKDEVEDVAEDEGRRVPRRRRVVGR